MFSVLWVKSINTNNCVAVFLFPGTRPGLCPVLDPTPKCAGKITGCDADERCSLGSRCCLQSDCTRKCVKAEMIPLPRECCTTKMLWPICSTATLFNTERASHYIEFTKAQNIRSSDWYMSKKVTLKQMIKMHWDQSKLNCKCFNNWTQILIINRYLYTVKVYQVQKIPVKCLKS